MRLPKVLPGILADICKKSINQKAMTQPDLFPELPRNERLRKSEKTLLHAEMKAIRADGMTARQVAEKVCVPLRTIERWYCGRSLPRGWVAKKIRLEISQIRQENRTI